MVITVNLCYAHFTTNKHILSKMFLKETPRNCGQTPGASAARQHLGLSPPQEAELGLGVMARPDPLAPGTHMELIDLGEPPVDHLLGQVLPLHQEHVHLGAGGPHSASKEASPCS